MIAPGTHVLSQGSGQQHGIVLDKAHPLAGWVWVQWDGDGMWDEWEHDLTVLSPDDDLVKGDD